MKKQTIVQVLWSLGRAGAERMVLDLAVALSEKYNVHVIAAGGGGEMEKDFKEAEISVSIGPTVSSWRRTKTLAFLKKQFEKIKPDLVHAHLSEIWVDRALSCLKKQIPWMITAHNDDRDESWLHHKARGYAFRHADLVACVSRTVASYVKKEFHVPSSHLSIVRNGVNLSRVVKRRPVAFHDPWRLISVGRLTAQKDQATLLRAVAKLPFRWTLDVLGQGEERHALEALARILGIADRVHFCGLVDDVSERLSQADLFCFPSQWEGQGIALLEAAASNLSVLASDLPVFHESFDASSVSFAKPHDPLAWSRALLFIRKNQEETVKKSVKAEKIVEQELTVEKMTEGYRRLYQTIL